jgi:hypothetical protein
MHYNVAAIPPTDPFDKKGRKGQQPLLSGSRYVLPPPLFP